ncbi:MAG TPA: YrdB family protein [Lacunisphaera sp.]|nr:YrdB family protein [Lacunisphaera sp.]
MANHPLNLAFRFLLECGAVWTFARFGMSLGEGAARYGWACLLALGAMLIWGVFRMPNDGGRPVVPVSGRVRLVLEFTIFAFATGALFRLGEPGPAWLLVGAVAVHYSLSYDRVGRMLHANGAARKKT